MPTVKVNGVRLFYELSGSGDIPIVFVHGGWSSHHSWDFVAPKLADSFRVLTYDRRGHSQSERPDGQGSIREDVADLAALIDHLALGPSWIAGLSSGASIIVRLAGERPELFRGLIAHEPALFSLLADDPTTAPMLEEGMRTIATVVEQIDSGDPAAAAEHFFEKIVGAGSWAKLPHDFQQGIVENAPTFLDDIGDSEVAFDLGGIGAFPHPTLLTKGDQSPATFAPIVSKLADVIPDVEVVTLSGAGHIPQITHPDVYVEMISTFMDKNSILLQDPPPVGSKALG